MCAALTLALACNKEDDPKGPKEKAAYGVSTSDATTYDLTFGKSKSVQFFIESRNGVVDENNLTFTVKADPSLVEGYLKDKDLVAEALPENAYSFTETELSLIRYNKKSLAVSVKVEMLYEMKDISFVLPITIASISGSDNAVIADDAALFLVFNKQHADVDKGKGTKAEPYLIYDAQDLMDMHEEIKEVDTTNPNAEPTYFKMMADVTLNIDREDEKTWEPLNWASPYAKKVDFDGNGHTIKGLVCMNYKYSSMFGVVYGDVYNVTFDGAYIEGTEAMGVVGGYAGTTGIPAYIHDVRVINSELYCNGGSKNGCGGIAGRAAEATIERCSFDGDINSIKNYCGGILGHDAGLVAIKDCMTSGRINPWLGNKEGFAGGQRVGGILGGFTKAETDGKNSSVKNCITTMGVTGRICVGGIVGQANADKWPEQNPHNEVSGCIAWCDSLAARLTTTANSSSGAIIAYTSLTNTLSKCWRKHGLTVFYDDPEVATFFAIVDQPDASAGSPLSVGIDCDASTKYKAYYNGQEAAEGKTASDIAKQIGWDETVWDLSGSIPALKK